ncbi:MAG: hypothetical protein PHQ64_04480, partial [Bacilli bacterium]|nr:hypothetical protein [Bacilli bacterium]
MVNLNFYISSKVNLNLLEDLVPISELDKFTTSEFDSEKDIINDKRYSYKIDNFKSANSNYIRSIVESHPNKKTVGEIKILADIGGEVVSIRPFYKNEDKLEGNINLRKNIMKHLRNDNTLRMLYDVINLYGDKLFFTEYNKIKYNYLRNVKNLHIYHKQKIGSQTSLSNTKKELLRVIEN